MEEKNISDYRAELDAIDREIVRLYSERVDIIEKIGEYKKAHGLPVLDGSREKEIFSRLKNLCGEDIYPDIEQLYTLILTLSKSRQAQ